MKRTNLIPLAGAGQRFRDEGYRDPKPLISVSGLPMIVQAARVLPPAEKHVFICRSEHLENYLLSEVLRTHFPQPAILSVDYLTEGQACTCLLGKNDVDPESTLTIGACDNSMVYDRQKIAAMMEDRTVDAIIWTFRNNPTVKTNPRMYGWVQADKQGYAKNVSVKIPLSDTPINDHAVVGTFTFRKSSVFFDYAQKMIDANRKINNEFYVDECMNLLIEDGLHVRVFEIDNYICWGTPNDLRTFEYWQQFFNLADHHPYSIKKDKTHANH